MCECCSTSAREHVLCLSSVSEVIRARRCLAASERLYDIMNAFKKALTGLAFGALLAIGAVATTPAAHAQYYPGLSAGAMSSVGGHSAAAGGFSASRAGAWGSGSASFSTYGGWGGYGTYGTADSASGGFSRAMGQHAAAGFSAFGSGNVTNGYYVPFSN